MRLLIIGHSVLDFVENKNITTIQPGGMFYSAAGFASQKCEQDKLYLLTSTDGINDEHFKQIYSQFDLSFSEKTTAIPNVHLKIWDNKEREERFENFTEELSLKCIDNFNQFDGIFINMISGNDITIEDLLLLRKKFRGKIFLDVHALSKGIDENNNRVFRKVPELKKWLSSVDIVQVNEFEFNTISEGNNQFEKANSVLQDGPEILILTKGNSGVRAFFKNLNEIESNFYAAEKVNSVNKIGCGDIFGAYFFYTYIKNKNLKFALSSANKAAAIATTYNSTQKFLNLKNDFVE